MKPIQKVWFTGFVVGKNGGLKASKKMQIHFPQIKCWVPAVRKRKVKKDKIIIDAEPLYENYIFVQLAENESFLQNKIIKTTPILYFLKDDDNYVHLSTEDIIHLELVENFLTVPLEYPCRIGDAVEVLKGEYEGYEGIVCGWKGGFAVVIVNIHGFQKKVPIPIPFINKIGETGNITIYAEGGDFNVKER